MEVGVPDSEMCGLFDAGTRSRTEAEWRDLLTNLVESLSAYTKIHFTPTSWFASDDKPDSASACNCVDVQGVVNESLALTACGVVCVTVNFDEAVWVSCDLLLFSGDQRTRPSAGRDVILLKFGEAGWTSLGWTTDFNGEWESHATAARWSMVFVRVRIENLLDLHEVDSGTRVPSAVRSVDVPDALVHTRTPLLALPKQVIEQLGLKYLPLRRSGSEGETGRGGIFGTVRLTVQGRDCTCDVMEVPDDCGVLIGQVPLALLDFVVDPVGQRLIGNPAHGGEHVVELY